MHVSLNVLAILDMVDKHGSLISASKYLFKTPAALSYQIQKFEQVMGVKIFDRTGHRIKFTNTGRMIMEQGRSLLEGAKMLENNARKNTTGWESELKILIADHFPFHKLIPLLNEFYETKTATNLRLKHKNLTGLWQTSANDADIIIAPIDPPPPSSEFTFHETGKVDNVFVVSPEHPLAAKKIQLSHSDIMPYLRVSTEGENMAEDIILPSNSLQEKQPRIVVDNVDTKLSALLSGLGCGFLPLHIAQRYLKTGELIKKELTSPYQSNTMYIVWRSDCDGLAGRWWREKLLSLMNINDIV